MLFGFLVPVNEDRHYREAKQIRFPISISFSLTLFFRDFELKPDHRTLNLWNVHGLQPFARTSSTEDSQHRTKDHRRISPLQGGMAPR